MKPKKTKKKLTAGQRRAIAALKRWNKQHRRGGKSSSSSTTKKRRRSKRRASKTGSIRAPSTSSTSTKRRKPRRRASSGKSMLKVLMPSALMLEVAGIAVVGDVVEDVITKGGKFRFVDHVAGELVMLGLAHGSNKIVNVGLGLELRKLAQEHYGENKETGLPRRSLEDLAGDLIRKMLPGGRSGETSELEHDEEDDEAIASNDLPEEPESAASSETY